jgi:dihydrofolate synthase/folylpolyglutamate synthase
MAFEYFSKEKVDIAIIETGLGGRLDSTNIIIPEISFITNISLDHTDMLGNSIKEIAFEKAGIIKKGVPVVIGESNNESDPVFLEKANEYNATIYFADQTYSAFISDDRFVYISSNKDENAAKPLKIANQFPSYQIKNILGVCQVCKILSTGYYKNIAVTDIPEVLNDLFSKPSIRGRWQILQRNPLIICDVAHNKAGISEIIKEIQKQSYRNLHIVLGMVNDKDVNRVLELLPTGANYYFCQAKIPRAMPAPKLKSLAEMKGLLGEVIEDVNEAIETAKSEANEDDLIFVGGSTFVVAEIEGLMIDTGSN